MTSKPEFFFKEASDGKKFRQGGRRIHDRCVHDFYLSKELNSEELRIMVLIKRKELVSGFLGLNLKQGHQLKIAQN